VYPYERKDSLRKHVTRAHRYMTELLAGREFGERIQCQMGGMRDYVLLLLILRLCSSEK